MRNISAIRRAKPAVRPWLPSPVQILVLLSDLVATWERRARERNHLAGMTDHMLKDLGISRSDAQHESDKPVWRA